MTTQQSREITPINAVCEQISLREDKFKDALPPHVDPKKFTRVAITAIQNTPDLQAIASQSPAARNSIYTACARAAADGLMPDGREGAIVAFNRKVSGKGQPDKWEKHAQWMPMVEGLRKMVRNSGEIANISVQVVRDKDSFDYQLGDQEYIIHKPALKARGAIVGAYSIATLKSGEKSREYMDVEEIEAVRTRSKSKDTGPWKTDYSEMCRKTVFRRHYKSLPKSTDLDKVIENDDDYSDPSIAVHEANQPAAPAKNYDQNTGEVFTQEQETTPAPKPRKASRASAAATMKQADVVEETAPAPKKQLAYRRSDTQPAPQVIEEEVNFEDDGGYHEEEGDVV